MFLHVSVCPREGVPGQVPPRAGTPPWAGIPFRAGTPPGSYPPPPGAAGRYGQQVGGTHPTGMHSCCVLNFGLNCSFEGKSVYGVIVSVFHF